MMRVRCVEVTCFVFGQAEWGGHPITIPVLPGSTVYADRIRCHPATDQDPRLHSRVDAYVSTPLYVRNPDRSLTVYEVQGGDLVTDDTLRDDAALSAWEAWVDGVGATDAQH
jgi:hypothetical protein